MAAAAAFSITHSALKLADRARRQGNGYLTAWQRCKAGKLSLPARQLPSGAVLVDEPNPEGRTVLYARVAAADQEELQRQIRRLQAFAREQSRTDCSVVAEVGSGLNGKRKKLLRLLRDPRVSRIVVERRDRLTPFGFEMIEAALAAAGKRVVVAEEGEVTDDLGRDLLEILTAASRRAYGRRARKAPEALGCG